MVSPLPASTGFFINYVKAFESISPIMKLNVLHKKPVNAITISPDGKYMASGGVFFLLAVNASHSQNR